MMKLDYFARPSYILFDLPEAATLQVNEIRRQFDPNRSNLNAEVSLTGSSGVGTLVAGQSEQKVFAEISRIAAMLTAFSASFGGIGSFPGTGIYFFTMSDEQVFRRIHQLFCEADIQYNSSPYAYLPHCTLTLFDNPLPPETAEKIMKLPIPRDPFRIDNISVYSIDANGLNPELRFRVDLKNQ